jgi:hypothetical protein
MNQFDSVIHAEPNKTLDKLMVDMFVDSSTGTKEDAMADVAAFIYMISSVCESTNVSTVSELECWCTEKELNNVEWNEKHLKMLENKS